MKVALGGNCYRKGHVCMGECVASRVVLRQDPFLNKEQLICL